MNTTSITAGLPSVTFWSVIIILTTTSPGGLDTRTENIFPREDQFKYHCDCG